jgi:hypothetical protein
MTRQPGAEPSAEPAICARGGRVEHLKVGPSALPLHHAVVPAAALRLRPRVLQLRPQLSQPSTQTRQLTAHGATPPQAQAARSSPPSTRPPPPGDPRFQPTSPTTESSPSAPAPPPPATPHARRPIAPPEHGRSPHPPPEPARATRPRRPTRQPSPSPYATTTSPSQPEHQTPHQHAPHQPTAPDASPPDASQNPTAPYDRRASVPASPLLLRHRCARDRTACPVSLTISTFELAWR